MKNMENKNVSSEILLIVLCISFVMIGMFMSMCN